MKHTIKNSKLGELELRISEDFEHNGKFIFHSTTDGGAPLVLTKEGFYYMGKRIDDIHDAYTRFNEWLKRANADTK